MPSSSFRRQKRARKPQGQSRNLIKQFAPSRDNNRIYKMRVVNSGTLASAAVTGVINAQVTLNPSGAAEWSSISTLYDEFRVCGVRISLIPSQINTVTNAQGILVMAFDNDDATALTSVNSGLEYDTCQILQAIWDPKSASASQYSWSRPTSGNSTAIIWCDVATPTQSVGSVKFYSSTLTVSTLYIAYTIEYFIEFRGRR
jgi:hypothetical protein